ncbi:hypothetical protein HPB50_023555 [Hyalomma asiaticum]|uniref:Uncharacterized protein n=1 Tax=Hyalomma asiaticum TaxID=266040 RepID=A0ACB7SB66_HYAAI|nr:hypothetical protein HPB50_023555 [Hyalomma asiaticum]
MAAQEITKDVWSIVERFVMFHEAGEPINREKFDAVAHLLQQKPVASVLTPWFLHEYEEQLRRDIIPRFWSSFKSAAKSNLKDTRVTFTRAVTELHATIEKCLSSARLIASSQANLGGSDAKEASISPRSSILDNVYDSLQAALKLSVPPEFNQVLLKFYSAAFRAFHHVAGEDDGNDQYECTGCELETDNCECSLLLSDFENINKKLHDLRLLDAVVRDAVSTVAYKYIEKHIQGTCRGNFESRFLDNLEKWLATTVMEWFRLLYKYETGPETDAALRSLEDHLRYFLYDTYVMARVDQLFNIIIEFPESQAALEDLKDCLERTNLRTREDTVRSIVSNLTDDSCAELEAELVKFTPISVEDSCMSDDDDEDWQNWRPAPLGNEPVQVSKGARTSDIVSMLVNIYGSKKLFASEYQVLLANRLLSGNYADTEREVRYLECLKLRFGEAQLHACEVMLRDLADSRRLNAHLASGDIPGYTEGVHSCLPRCMAASSQCWLCHRRTAAVTVGSCAVNIVSFGLLVSRNFDLVLEIDTGTRTLQLTVSPMHATLIYHFQEKPRWTLDELSAVTQASSTLVRRKLALWQGQGILWEESPGVFALGSHGGSTAGGSIPPQPLELDEDEEETPSAMASTQDQKESDLQIYWSYIVGMLTNLEALTSERIHTMLKMFAMQTPSTAELTAQELRHFLDSQVAKQKLLYSGGHYRLPKSDGQ